MLIKGVVHGEQTRADREASVCALSVSLAAAGRAADRASTPHQPTRPLRAACLGCFLGTTRAANASSRPRRGAPASAPPREWPPPFALGPPHHSAGASPAPRAASRLAPLPTPRHVRPSALACVSACLARGTHLVARRPLRSGLGRFRLPSSSVCASVSRRGGGECDQVVCPGVPRCRAGAAHLTPDAWSGGAGGGARRRRGAAHEQRGAAGANRGAARRGALGAGSA